MRLSKDKTTVETSQHTRVPVKEAKLLYELILAKKDIRLHKIDGWIVTGINGTLRIGCHNINHDSMHRTGKQLLEL